jgi:hypothetical protein
LSEVWLLNFLRQCKFKRKSYVDWVKSESIEASLGAKFLGGSASIESGTKEASNTLPLQNATCSRTASVKNNVGTFPSHPWYQLG